MDKIKLLVAGLGKIGKVHAENIRFRIKQAELSAVVDIDENVARSLGEKLGVNWYTSYIKALEMEKPDAVIIATPTHLHKDCIIEAAKRGINIFTEKPLTPNLNESKEVVSIVRKCGVKLQIGFQRRFDPIYRQAKRFIEEGGIGKPIAFISIVRDPKAPPAWARDPRKSGGMFADQLSHDFDIARFLLNDEIVEVYVIGDIYIYEDMRDLGDPDASAIIFKTSRGLHGVIHATRKFPYGYELKNEIYGTDGVVYIGTNKDERLAFGVNQGLIYKGAPWFEKRWSEAYLNELEEFVMALLKNGEPSVNLIDGLRASQIAEACWQSYREGRPAKVPLD